MDTRRSAQATGSRPQGRVRRHSGRSDARHLPSGGTLGEAYKHWFRAKFLQQFRLFFRYQQTADAKVIVLAWVNDDTTLRAYESANDAYAVFRKMLDRGNPPDSWSNLVAAASAESAKRRLTRAAPRAVAHARSATPRSNLTR